MNQARRTSTVVGNPLNGEKTHPLSPFALRVMEDLRGGPMPRSGMNPGVVDRLLREGCVEVVDLPSPFKTHKGRLIPHLRLIEGAAPAPQQQFQTWQAFIHSMPKREGRSAPTHFRYCRWGTQRHRWLDEGHYFDLNVSENPELPTLHQGDYEVQLYHKFADTVEEGGKRTYYMTPVPLRPQQPNMRLRVQFVGRARPPEELPPASLGPVREGSVPEPAPAAKPTRKRCLGSGQTIALQGLQMVMRKAPCPLCGALRSIAPLPGRRAVFPRHNMRVAP